MRPVKTAILIIIAICLAAILFTSCAPKPYGRKLAEKTAKQHQKCPTIKPY